MLKRIIFAAGMGYLMRRLMGGRGMSPGYSRSGSRWGNRGMGW